ncbi:hypothetical protein [uncultured Streptomyces sp.]|uniref:hypothetical protein n=1 Tax=uncultured Streptomyces sp. TaxID=174707 RepID=UPI002618CEBA|nr:hypothetical protein [uncultured Streptomyces sp.]
MSAYRINPAKGTDESEGACGAALRPDHRSPAPVVEPDPLSPTRTPTTVVKDVA